MPEPIDWKAVARELADNFAAEDCTHIELAAAGQSACSACIDAHIARAIEYVRSLSKREQ